MFWQFSQEKTHKTPGTTRAKLSNATKTQSNL